MHFCTVNAIGLLTVSLKAASVKIWREEESLSALTEILSNEFPNIPLSLKYHAIKAHRYPCYMYYHYRKYLHNRATFTSSQHVCYKVMTSCFVDSDFRGIGPSV